MCTGYRIDIVYLKLSSSRLALRRVAARVRQGGHNVPQADVVRRFVRGWNNFSASTARWPTAGRCMTIRDARRNCWRKIDEAESASEANPTAELCCWCGACLTPRSKGRAENCADVRHADLRLGKWQSRRQKAMGFFGQASFIQASAMQCSSH